MEQRTKLRPSAIFRKLRDNIQRLWKKEKNVYFISGMCYNCKVFDHLTLPKGFRKIYIEWYIPHPDESLSEYARNMAQAIDLSRPYILVGYSFGAVIMQEMNRFLNPEKSIIISSFKSKEEIPRLFRAAAVAHLAEKIPISVFSKTDFISDAFNYFVYDTPTAELANYMTYTDPVYIKWAVEQITQWSPETTTKHLYHIHGTEDQIFPFKQLKRVFPVEGGDHLMVVRKADVVSHILGGILLMRNEDSSDD